MADSTYSTDLDTTDVGASAYAGDDPIFVKEALGLIKESKSLWSKWRQKDKEAKRFFSGDQWDPADMAVLREKDRVPVVFNFTKKYINVLIGSEIHNRQEVKFVPRRADASTEVAALGELETAAYDWVIDQCLVGDTAVRTDSVYKGFSRLYTGPVIDIYLSNGKKLTGTPNHPMLTDVGWKPLGELHEGDNLIDDGFLKRISSLANHFKNTESSLKNVVDAIQSRRVPLTRPCIADNFHGDGVGSEIYIVGTDGLLANETKNIWQKSEASVFSRSFVSAVSPQFHGLGHLASSFKAALSNFSRIFMSQTLGFGATTNTKSRRLESIKDCPLSDSQDTSNIQSRFSCLVHFIQKLGRDLSVSTNFLVPESVSSLFQPTLYSMSCHSNDSADLPAIQILRKIKLGQIFGPDIAPFLTTTKISRIVRRVDAVHVYNLQTDSGIYIAQGVITSNCNGLEERTQAFKDVLISGMGWTEIFVDEEIDKDPRIVLRRVDGAEMMWDARAKMQNLEDTRWRARSKWVPLEVAIEHWPKHEELIRSMVEETEPMASLQEMPDEVHQAKPLLYAPDNQTVTPSEMARKGHVLITQFQNYILEKRYVLQDPTDKTEKELSESDFKKLERRLGDLDMPVPEYSYKTRRVYKQIFILGLQAGLAEAEELPVQAGGFTLKCITGEWDEAEKVHRGLLYSMMDPQRFINKYISQTTYIIACNPKGAIIAEVTALKDPQRVEAEIARPDSIILAKKDAIAEKRIMFTGPPQMPQATYEMAKFSIEALGGITGISPEMLGTTTGDQPALTGRQRQRSGMTIHAEYFDALTRYRRGEARTVLEYIRAFMPDGTLIRLGGSFSQQMVPMFKKSMLGVNEYDTAIDEAIRSPDAKAEVWFGLQPVLPVLVRAGLVIPELIDLIPSLPASMAAKIKQKLTQAGGIPPQQGRGGAQQKQPPSPEEMQGKMQKLQVEVKLAEAKIQEVLARARMLDESTKLKKIQLMGDMSLKQRQQASKEQSEQRQQQSSEQKDQAHLALTRESNQNKLISDSIARSVRPEKSGT